MSDRCRVRLTASSTCAGRADIPALLKPRVPGDAHAGQERDLLPAQAAAPACGLWAAGRSRRGRPGPGGPEGRGPVPCVCPESCTPKYYYSGTPTTSSSDRLPPADGPRQDGIHACTSLTNSHPRPQHGRRPRTAARLRRRQLGHREADHRRRQLLHRIRPRPHPPRPGGPDRLRRDPRRRRRAARVQHHRRGRRHRHGPLAACSTPCRPAT